MKAVEFEATVTAAGQIALPPEVANEIPPGEHLRIVVMWQPSDLDAEWRTAGRRTLEAAYAPEDEVYENLIDDSANG